jgi:hypothetical protein
LIRDIILNGFQDPINVNGYIQTDLGRVNVNFSKNLSLGQSNKQGNILNNTIGCC